MSLPKSMLEAFSPAEIEFQAQDEPISIIPNRQFKAVRLEGWSTPHLRPLVETKVPLWMALLLKKQERCNIRFPYWLDEEQLKKSVDEERSNPGFSSLPWFWQPLSHMLLTQAADDLDGDIDTVRQYLQELWEIRQVKITSGLSELMNSSNVVMNGIGAMELNTLRPGLLKSLTAINKLQPNPNEDEAEET